MFLSLREGGRKKAGGRTPRHTWCNTAIMWNFFRVPANTSGLALSLQVLGWQNEGAWGLCSLDWGAEGVSSQHSSIRKIQGLGHLWGTPSYPVRFVMLQSKNHSYTGSAGLGFLGQPFLSVWVGALLGLSALEHICGKHTCDSTISTYHLQGAEIVSLTSWSFCYELPSIPTPHFLESETAIGILTSVHGLGDPQKFYNGLHIYQSFFPFFIPFFHPQPVLPPSLSS